VCITTNNILTAFCHLKYINGVEVLMFCNSLLANLDKSLLCRFLSRFYMCSILTLNADNLLLLRMLFSFCCFSSMETSAIDLKL